MSHVDLDQAFARIESMRSSFYAARRWARKAERADQAGLGPAVAALHSKQGQLEINQALRQGRAAIAAIDDRLARKDWTGVVETLERNFVEHDGQDALDDARERIRLQLVELDFLPAEDIRPIVALIESRFARPPGGGLHDSIVNLRGALVAQMKPERPPGKGGKPTGEPGSTNDCAAVATAVAETAMIVCACIPFCWCCLVVYIIGAYLIALCVCYDSTWCNFTTDNGTDSS
jgi:hypothetical protein